MAGVLGLHRTSSRVSLNSTTSVAGSINTKNTYRRFCRKLFQIWVTAEMISQKEEEILNIFQPQDTVEMISQKEDQILDIFKPQDTTITGGERGDGKVADQRQLLAVGYFL